MTARDVLWPHGLIMVSLRSSDLTGCGQIKVQGDVHDEGLWPFVFKGEHTVGALHVRR